MYAAQAAEPRRPASEATFTTEPEPASSISGTTARVRRMRAVTLIRKTRSSVVVDFVDGEAVHDARDVREGVDPAARGGDDGGDGFFGGDVTGHGDQVKAPVPGHQGVQRSELMSAAMTRPPSLATRRAVARPMPEPAPVTMTVLPAKRPAVMVPAMKRRCP